jgi:chorismate mutase
MDQKVKYFIVEANTLPEIYRKVAEARQLLELGEEKTVNAAAKRVGISRSAFYKHRDSIQPFHDMLHGRILTFQLTLRHEPGVLSMVLNLFADYGANILTINQGIPVNGRAIVSIGAETSAMMGNAEELLAGIRNLKGVLRCELLAG